MKPIQDRIQEFFNNHPDNTECFEALGKVFAEKEKAQAFLAGVSGKYVTTHNRETQTFAKESDRIQFDINEKENEVERLQNAYEDATAFEKQQAMSNWDKAKRELVELQSRLQNQLDMEEKAELLNKDEKDIDLNVTREFSVDEWKKKIEAQQLIIDQNKELIEKMPDGQKKKKSVNAQKDEIKKLDQFKAGLKTAEQKEAAAGMIDHEVTEEDLTNNPELVEKGVKLGDTIQIPKSADKAPEETGSEEKS